MKHSKWVVALAVAMAMTVGLACSSDDKKPDDNTAGNNGPDTSNVRANAAAATGEEIPDQTPEWVGQPPAEPGKFFYAVGTGSGRNAMMAKMSSEQDGRRRLSEAIRGAVMAAAKQTFADAGVPQAAEKAASLADQVSSSLSGAEVASTYSGDGGQTIYTLHRVEFAGVADVAVEKAQASMPDGQSVDREKFAELMTNQQKSAGN